MTWCGFDACIWRVHSFLCIFRFWLSCVPATCCLSLRQRHLSIIAAPLSIQICSDGTVLLSIPSDPKTSRAEPVIGTSSMIIYESWVIESRVATISIHDRIVLILAALLVKSVIHLSLAPLTKLLMPVHAPHDGKFFAPKYLRLLQLTLLCLFILPAG